MRSSHTIIMKNANLQWPFRFSRPIDNTVSGILAPGHGYDYGIIEPWLSAEQRAEDKF